MSRPYLSFNVDSAVARNATNRIHQKNTELISYDRGKMLQAGYTDLTSLAKAFGTRNTAKVLNALTDFFTNGRLIDPYMRILSSLLRMDINTIKNMQDSHEKKIFAELDLFLSNFNLILRNSEFILDKPVYRNILVPGIYLSSAWVQRHRPLSLGELLHHWKQGKLVTPHSCGKTAHIYAAGGSVLSGSNRYHAYCPACGQRCSGSLPSFSSIWGPCFTNPPPYAYEAVDSSIKELLEELKA